MWLSDLFKTSHDRRFFDLLAHHAALLSEAARLLADYVGGGDPDLADRIAKLEQQMGVVRNEPERLDEERCDDHRNRLQGVRARCRRARSRSAVRASRIASALAATSSVRKMSAI